MSAIRFKTDIHIVNLENMDISLQSVLQQYKTKETRSKVFTTTGYKLMTYNRWANLLQSIKYIKVRDINILIEDTKLTDSKLFFLNVDLAETFVRKLMNVYNAGENQ